MNTDIKKKLNLPDPVILEELNIPVLDKHTKLIYHPFFGILYQERFRMALSGLEGKKERILEAGCGRGLLLAELSSRCSKLHSIDIHSRLDVVSRMLEKNNPGNIYLNTGSIAEMPYRDKVFDAVICISVLEHVVDLEKCFLEFFRVLKDSGELILGFPVKNRMTDFLFKLLKFDAARFHPSSHREILAAADGLFQRQWAKLYPAHLPLDFAFYFTGKFVKR